MTTIWTTFIEYDDDGEADGGGVGGRQLYGYEEDDSDMEAGLSDIDQEERRAAYFARKEDDEQERIEAERKRLKEARKRQILTSGGSRSGRKSRPSHAVVSLGSRIELRSTE